MQRLTLKTLARGILTGDFSGLSEESIVTLVGIVTHSDKIPLSEEALKNTINALSEAGLKLNFDSDFWKYREELSLSDSYRATGYWFALLELIREDRIIAEAERLETQANDALNRAQALRAKVARK